MTMVVLLLLGLGFILIVSGMETDSAGNDVSVVQTIQDVWNDKLQGNFFNPTPTPPGPPSPPGTQPGQPIQLSQQSQNTNQIQGLNL